MNISGITTCVGELYAGYLRQTLPVWLATLDSVTVITKWQEPEVCQLMRDFPVYLLPTFAFTRDGAYFNKGAALNDGYAAAKPTDWCLSFDCDTSPPPDWRTKAESIIEPGNLYGARRYAGTRPFMPYGYFQLWHTSDPAPTNPGKAGPFAACYAHGGRYDGVFLENWPEDRRRELPFRLKHHGPPRRHWFGVGNEHLMDDLLRGGARAYRDRDEKTVGP